MSDQKPSTSQIRQAIVSSLIGDVDHPCISIAHILGGLRKTLPLDEHSDWELEDLIALIAVDAGFAIEFDGSARALKDRQDHLVPGAAGQAEAKPPVGDEIWGHFIASLDHASVMALFAHFASLTINAVKGSFRADFVEKGRSCWRFERDRNYPENALEQRTSQRPWVNRLMTVKRAMYGRPDLNC